MGKSIWPICLPEPGTQFTNNRAFVIGWGTIYSAGPVSNTLQEVNVRVWENSECAKNYATLSRVVTDYALCRGDQQGQLPGGQWGPSQLYEQEHRQVGALRGRLLGSKMCPRRISWSLHENY